jgi:argininosuccinate lyase
MKMWGGRFRQPIDPEFQHWQSSFEFDRRLLKYEVAASCAHARALKNAGILSSEELRAILQGLDKIAAKAANSSVFLEDEEAEDVHHFVQKQLASFIGEVAYKLHSGRSRNEQIATDLRLYIRASIDQLQNDLAEWLDILLESAAQAQNAVMPAYTHLQRAEPVLVAHYLLAYVEMFLRDSGRLADCRTRLNVCPLGSGAVAGSTIALDRRAMAAELGFSGPTANSIDATSDRDFVLELVNVLAMIALHLSRWAEEMILFSSEEFGFVRLPEAYSTGSSAMPQKKNPDLLELTRGKVARVIAAANSLMIVTKGLPLAYNKDLQETQEPLFDAVATISALLPLASAWMKAAEFNYGRMREAAETGFMNAWAAATYLVHRGVPSALAHEQIGMAVQLCLEKGCGLDGLSLKELRALDPVFDTDFYACLQLDSVLAIHDVAGGTAPGRVRQAILQAKQRIETIREESHANA